MGAVNSIATPLLLAPPSGPRSELDPSTAAPSLLLLRELVEQSIIDAAHHADEVQELLHLLATPDVQLDEATCTAKIREYGGWAAVGGAGAAGAGASAMAVDGSDGGAGALVLAGPGSGAGAGVTAGVGAAGGLPALRRLARHYVALAASNLDRQVQLRVPAVGRW